MSEQTPDPDTLEIPDWHWEIIEERLRRIEENPDEGIPWEEANKHLEEWFEKEFGVKLRES